jgi:hypothetical protein
VLLKAGADPSITTPVGVSAYRLALRFGLGEVAECLRGEAEAELITEEEPFIAACARGDEAEARRIGSKRPDLPAALPEKQLRLLPDLTAEGVDEAARLMTRLGWPIALRGDDWNASALNLAVFRGDAALTRFLLEHGTVRTEEHGYGDNACGTLSWASCNEPVEGGDWVGCAQALLEYGMPRAKPDHEESECVLIAGRRKRFSDEVSEVLLDSQATS